MCDARKPRRHVLTVAVPVGRALQIHVLTQPNASVAKLKGIIFAQEGVVLEYQILSCAEIHLCNEDAISEYDTGEGTRVEMMLTLRSWGTSSKTPAMLCD